METDELIVFDSVVQYTSCCIKDAQFYGSYGIFWMKKL